jgi:hypothetical protein
MPACAGEAQAILPRFPGNRAPEKISPSHFANKAGYYNPLPRRLWRAMLRSL